MTQNCFRPTVRILWLECTGASFACRNCPLISVDAGPMDALHLLLQSLVLAQTSDSGLQQLQLRDCNVVDAAALGRNGLMHVTSLVLLQMSGEILCEFCRIM